MGLLSFLCPSGRGYTPCDEHGHDYRENGDSTMDADLTVSMFRNGYESDVLPDKYLGLLEIVRKTEVPCRDCGEMTTKKTVLQKFRVAKEDEDFKMIHEDEWADMIKQAREEHGEEED